MPLSPRHWALAAEAVTAGPMVERDIVERVAHAIADAEARGPVAAPGPQAGAAAGRADCSPHHGP